MNNPFKRPVVETTIGEELVATFTGRASPEMAMECFGWLMGKLKLWAKLDGSEDVALHNTALDILAIMRAGPTVNLKDLGKLTLVIEHEQSEG